MTIIDAIKKANEDIKLIKKGRVRMDDFEIVPYKFSQSYKTGKRIEIKDPAMYVSPVDEVFEIELQNGVKYYYKCSSTSFEFHYIVGTAIRLIYGDADYRKDKSKQYDAFFGRYFFGIANKVHFQVKTDFGLVVWSFIRKRKRNIKMSKRRKR